MAQTLTQLVDSVRNYVNDNSDSGIFFHSNEMMVGYINKAMKVINNRLLVYQKYQFIIPELYIDEYNLANDYIRLKALWNIYDQVPFLPEYQAEVESGMSDWWRTKIGDSGEFYINETDNKLTFNDPPNSSDVEPKFDIVAGGFTQGSSYIDIDNHIEATSALTDATKWEKGWIKLFEDADETNCEYCRYSKVIDETTYVRLYMPRWAVNTGAGYTDGTGIDKAKFVSYIMEYFALPPNLVSTDMDNQYTQFENELDELITILASHYAFLRESNAVKAREFRQMFEDDLKEYEYQLADQKDDLRNRKLENSGGW